jgi:hypothetical protein
MQYVNLDKGMSCSRGEAAPNSHTKLKLFADSGGYCQNPDCNSNLFLTIGASEFHIAEMAHIISAGDKGPRTDSSLTPADKGDFANLILLCPTCHTKIDKAEEEYPNTLIIEWKKKHSEKIRRIFNIKQYQTRDQARNAVVPLLTENKVIFDTYGPMTDARFNPESEMPMRWLAKVHQSILPNNRKLLNILDMNYGLLLEKEKETVELYRQHVFDFEQKHINKADIDSLQFPIKMSLIFTD